MENNEVRLKYLLELSRLCLAKKLSKQQLVALMEPIRNAENNLQSELIAQRLIEEVKKM